MAEYKGDSCIFCKIATGEISVERVAESENFLAFPDANPKVEGHTLIVPKKHFDSILELPPELGGELLEFIKLVAEKKMKETGAKAFNLIVNTGREAGQVVSHAHMHIIPRVSA